MQTNLNKNSLFFERLLQVIDYYGIKNINSFAKDYLNYSSSEKINRLKKPNNSPSMEIIIDISNKFDLINIEWLLTGKGEMLKNEVNSIDKSTDICPMCKSKDQIIELQNKLIHNLEYNLENIRQKCSDCAEMDSKKGKKAG